MRSMFQDLLQYIKIRMRRELAGIDVEFLIDSGAMYSAVPEKILDEICVEPCRTINLSLANGTNILRRVGEAYFERAD